MTRQSQQARSGVEAADNRPLGSRSLRNVAIVAHVDHGKTTLVDAMLHQTGVFRRNEQVPERALDSHDLERERGITILAKHTSVQYRGTRINIIDTPGHADFGGEVERTLMLADGALLIVDAAEGPLPQTRFVLQHALGLGLPIVVAINKIDRHDARPDEVLSEVFDLFCELEASDEQADFATLYTIGKLGQCKRAMSDDLGDLGPLFETLIARIPPPEDGSGKPLQMLVANIQHDDYVGRLGMGRVVQGSLRPGQLVMHLHKDGERRASVGKLYRYEGLRRVDVEDACAGDIVSFSGIEELQIGDTVTALDTPVPLPRIEISDPTIKMRFQVNSSPFAGQSGQFITSRHLRDRLQREARRNLAMRCKPTDQPDAFTVYGRGELMLAVLVENMRREGYELSLGTPEAVQRDRGGVIEEPFERAVVDVPEEHVGVVTSKLGQRGAHMIAMSSPLSGRVRSEFRISSRNLIGYRSEFLTDTRGTGLLTTLFDGWAAPSCVKVCRKRGAMVADRKGNTTPYALFQLQPRGRLFVGPGRRVYEGMIVGEHNRANDLDVNVTREKKLTNIRAAGRDENVVLSPPLELDVETAMEFIDSDELVEVTPDAVRVRKKILSCNRRPKRTALLAG
ncbi:MAG: translational GTPase TypA [Proteobacteria bacterium]|nr:translational GTPase TypA [Pseudomonadota bacterium]